MKKSLIALAVLAASGAAMAQSSVTLYGIADVWVGSSKVQANSGAGWVGDRQTVLEDGGVSNSRIGFKGTEDLGGGLKALFVLEQGFQLDTGNQAEANKAFSREASIGLAGGFGEVKLGKVWNAFDDISGAAASTFDSDLAPINTVFLSTAFADNTDNGVRYTSPSFGGFSGSASYAFGEDKTAATSASESYALSVKYEAGPIYAGLAYAEFTEGPTDISADAVRLNGAYDLGVAKLLATYGRVNEDAFDSKTNEYEIGVNVPLSGALSLSAGYAASKTKVGGATAIKTSGFGAAVAYSLSKRTTAYAGLNNTSSKDGADFKFAKSSTYAVGVKHTF